MTDADTTERELDTPLAVEDEAEDATAEAGADEGDDLEERLVAEGEIAGDYLEELLDLLDFDGDIDLDVEGNRAIVSIDGSELLVCAVGGSAEQRKKQITRGAEGALRILSAAA